MKRYKGFTSLRSPAYRSHGWRVQESPRFGGVFGLKNGKPTWTPYSKLKFKRR